MTRESTRSPSYFGELALDSLDASRTHHPLLHRTKEIRDFVCSSIGILPMRKVSNTREDCEIEVIKRFAEHIGPLIRE